METDRMQVGTPAGVGDGGGGGGGGVQVLSRSTAANVWWTLCPRAQWQGEGGLYPFTLTYFHSPSVI